jgi:uncharacterized membrane protein
VVLDVANALTPTDPQETINIMKKYNASYIFISTDEKMKAWAIFKISNKDPEQYLTQEKEFTSLEKRV